MRSMLIAFGILFAANLSAWAQSNVEALGLAIVAAARVDAGVSPGGARLVPLASGPFVLDSSTFRGNFDVAYGEGAGASVVQALASNGNSFGDHELLRRSSADSTGSVTEWLDGDPIILNLLRVIRYGAHAEARITMFHKYRKVVCPRSLELKFRWNGATWTLEEQKMIGNC
jgi:hypothetical protein